MPTRREWRHILQRALAIEMSDDGETPFPVYPYAVGTIESLPCVVIQQGADGTYVEPANPAGTLSTLCNTTARFTAWLTCGDPLTEQAADTLDEMIDRLYAGSLAAAVSDELNPAGFRPALGPVGSPGATEHGGMSVWWAPVPIAVPVPRITTP
jgi:hypothetical protein